MRYQQPKLRYTILAGAFLLFVGAESFAQEHLIHRPQHKWFRLAEEQFHARHYRMTVQSAEHFSSDFFQNVPARSTDETERVRYFQTLSQLRLNENGAEDSAARFLSFTSNPAYSQRVSLALAQYYFRNEALEKAIPYYESANISNLTNREIADSKFELAYSYFYSRQFDKAEPLFASIKELQGKYYLTGNYYYGLLAYNDGKYEEALKSFKRIDNEPQYRSIVPYYIAEIYYFMGEREKALDEAMRLTRKKEKLYYDNELHLLIAQILFEDQRYGDALPYFEHYYKNTDKIRKEELYEIGYSYYRVNEWRNAIEKFKPLSSAYDSLGQTAMYLLGDCYLKTGNKRNARSAFGFAADMPFSRGQQEAALLLYGKLSYEMRYNEDAIRSFTTLIEEFPQSVHSSEARTFLSDLLIKTNKFEEAYYAMKDVAVKNNNYWKVWQKVTYGYAMHMLREGDLGKANSLLTASLQRPSDDAYEAAARFWRGDIAYRQNRFENALDDFRQFVNKAENSRDVEELSPQATLSNAYFTMGYAAMNTEDYTAAQNYFSKARQRLGDNPGLALNASMRAADAAFMQKNFGEALTLYEEVIAADTTESDYARLQKGILLGVQGKTKDKISLLQQLIHKKPQSEYAHEARYELGGTYIEEGKHEQAVRILMPLTEEADARDYAAKAWMRIGLAYQELENAPKSIAAFKKVVTDFPASEDRNAALESLRNLFIESNQPEAYNRLLENNNLPSLGMATMDSTYYATAEAQIASGNWDNAKATLTGYLEKFPNGSFTTRAHYYKAESHFKLKETEAAFDEYDAVLALPWNEFSEASAKRAAEMAYKEEKYLQAIKYYSALRNSAISAENLQLAYGGLMRSYYGSNQFAQASDYADTLLALPELSPEIMEDVRLFKATSLHRSGHIAEASLLYKQLLNAKNENIAAEARYRIAEGYYQQNKLKEAETAAAEALKQNAGNDYWVIKSYLLIADILVKQKDYFNAKATLQSLVKNTKDAALKKEAAEKLEEVKKLEREQSKLKED